MTSEFFLFFEQADYPCYFLSADGRFLLNEAARQAGGTAHDEKTVRLAMELALRKKTGDVTQRALPAGLPGLSDLTMLPVAEGLLAVAQPASEASVYSFSSQMREPLTNIFAALPLLSAHLDDVGYECLESVMTSSYQLLRLSNNIENMARLRWHAPSRGPVDMVSLVDALCASVKAVCRGLGIPLSWHLPEGVLPVYADTALLSDAILNIVRNSMQYTRDGNAITLRLRRLKDMAVLTVEDKGIGITAENLAKVFEPFFSADPYGDTGEQPGMGLGLSVAHQLAAALGGRVGVESQFGKGTQLTLSLPVDDGGGGMLRSEAADYLSNRFSAVYVQLCGLARLPNI